MNKIVLGCLLASCALTQGCSSGYEPARSPRVQMVIDDGALSFVRDGERYHNGFVTGSGAMDAVSGNPHAEAEARTARNLQIGSFVFGVAALGSATGALAVAGTNDGAQRHEATVNGLLISTLVCELVTLGLAFSSMPHLYDAVNIYNDDLDRGAAGPRLQRPAPPPPEETP
jgi:hypothetical protein